MRKFKNLEEIRVEIDKIDLKILELISKRKDLVTEVVRLKERDQIVDKKRIEEILRNLDFESEKKGLPKKLVQDLWKRMIKAFIKYEEEIFDKKLK